MQFYVPLFGRFICSADDFSPFDASDSPKASPSSQLGGLHVHVFAVSKLIFLCTHTCEKEN